MPSAHLEYIFLRRVQRTYITPSRRPVNGVAVPYNRIDEEIEAGNTGPGHIQTCSGIPRFQVPREGDTDEHEAQKSKDGIDVVGIITHSLTSRRSQIEGESLCVNSGSRTGSGQLMVKP